jgi:hypothetical protein
MAETEAANAAAAPKMNRETGRTASCSAGCCGSRACLIAVLSASHARASHGLVPLGKSSCLITFSLTSQTKLRLCLIFWILDN